MGFAKPPLQKQRRFSVLPSNHWFGYLLWIMCSKESGSSHFDFHKLKRRDVSWEWRRNCFLLRQCTISCLYLEREIYGMPVPRIRIPYTYYIFYCFGWLESYWTVIMTHNNINHCRHNFFVEACGGLNKLSACQQMRRRSNRFKERPADETLHFWAHTHTRRLWIHGTITCDTILAGSGIIYLGDKHVLIGS